MTKALLVVLLSAGGAWSQEAVELRFEDLPRLVREKNQAVAGAGLLVESARARDGHLGRSFLPSVALDGGGEHLQTGPYSARTQPYGQVEGRLNLYRGGRDRLEAEVRGRETALAAGDAERVLAEELEAARALYWELVCDRETAKVVADARARNEKHLEMAARRIARGLATETDRLDFEIHRSQLDEELDSLAHAVLLRQLLLAAALGLPPQTKLNTPDKIEHAHDEALLEAAFDPASHPEASALEARRQRVELERAQERRWWTPSVDAYGGYGLYTLRERDYLSRSLRDDTAVGVRLSLGVFDGLRSRAEASALALKAQGLARQRTQRELALDARVRAAKEYLKHDDELVHWAEARIEQGRRYLALTLGEYERGVKNSADVLAAAQKHLAFTRQHADRRRDYELAKAALSALLRR